MPLLVQPTGGAFFVATAAPSIEAVVAIVSRRRHPSCATRDKRHARGRLIFVNSTVFDNADAAANRVTV